MLMIFWSANIGIYGLNERIFLALNSGEAFKSQAISHLPSPKFQLHSFYIIQPFKDHKITL